MRANEYNECVNLFTDNVFRYAVKITANTELAKDIVQDSFEKLWINRANVEFKASKSWLFTTVYRRMIDIYRKNKRAEIYKSTLDLKQEYSLQYDKRDQLTKAFSLLDEKQKNLILLRDYEGYNYDEIAKMTDLSLSQVKVYLFRARKKMKSILVNLDYTP